MRRNLRPLEPGRDIFGDHLGGVREALTAGKLLAVVDDVNLEANLLRHYRKLVTDVAGADDVELGRWFDRLDVDAHLASADQSRLLREVIVQLVVHELRLPVRDGFASLPERIVLVTAAADRADQPPVGEDQHLRPDTLRSRPGGRDDGDERG